MTAKRGDQKKARAVQALTGWSYMESLRASKLEPSAIAALIKMRGGTFNQELGPLSDRGSAFVAEIMKAGGWAL